GSGGGSGGEGGGSGGEGGGSGGSGGGSDHGHGCSFRAAGDSAGDASLLGLAFAGLLALRRRSVSKRA
ncbi:PE-PGRS family protein, partial [Polyangium fumosum]